MKQSCPGKHSPRAQPGPLCEENHRDPQVWSRPSPGLGGGSRGMLGDSPGQPALSGGNSDKQKEIKPLVSSKKGRQDTEPWAGASPRQRCPAGNQPRFPSGAGVCVPRADRAPRSGSGSPETNTVQECSKAPYASSEEKFALAF